MTRYLWSCGTAKAAKVVFEGPASTTPARVINCFSTWAGDIVSSERL